MPIYYVSLRLTSPPNYHDSEVIELLRQAADRTGGPPIEVTPVGLIVDCDITALELLETAIRTKLGARGGMLEGFVARQM